MKLTESWLRTMVDVNLSAADIAHQLTMAGLEVDDASPKAPPFTGVVVGEVLSIAPHPDADRLKVTHVSIGQETLQIVCGANNVDVGLKVPVATIGAVLPNQLVIKKGKLRGVESSGMLCGASELGLVDEVDGLMILPVDAPIGVDVRTYLQLDDVLFDISITPNRGDCLSVLGIARELSVLQRTTLTPPNISECVTQHQHIKTVTVDNANSCPVYYGRLILNVPSAAPTPVWMKQRLADVGIVSRGLVVDVTNYVMLTLGQPMHGFDAEKLGDLVTVRLSRTGEALTLLNGQVVTLDDDTLVITNGDQPIALAGIMGGESTAISEHTTHVFLESAHFAQLAIAGRARRYGLHTDASARFERGVDPRMALMAMDYATQLIQEALVGIAPTLQIGPIHGVGDTMQFVPPVIHVSLADITARIGFAVDAAFVVETLTQLGCQVQTVAADTWQITPPSHRFDLSIKEDIAEEVARVYGYDNIPFSLPTQATTLPAHQDHISLTQLRATLNALGYFEAVSFSFVDPKIDACLPRDAHPALALANPIASDLAVMRRTVLASLIPCVLYNINRQQPRVRLFETGLRFKAGDSVKSLEQIPTLAWVATGATRAESWDGKAMAIDFYGFKGEVEQLLGASGVGACEHQPCALSYMHPGQSAQIVYNSKIIGYYGRLHPKAEQSLGLPATWVCEFDLLPLQAAKHYTLTTLSKFPEVRRDIAVIVDKALPVAQLKQCVMQHGGKWMTNCIAFDVYAGTGIDAGCKSVAFALFWQHTERTLEEAEIKDGMNQVIQSLEKTFNAILRSS